jgi:protein ImuB
VLDVAGRDVVVDVRLAASGEPALVRWGGPDQEEQKVVGWAGPWPLAERWWCAGPRRVHLQVVLDDGRGLLLAQSAGRWQVEALYD